MKRGLNEPVRAPGPGHLPQPAPPASRTDGNTLAFDYSDTSCGTPPEWWQDARIGVCRLMRESHEDGLTLAEHLEPLREWLTVQLVLAVRRELSLSATPA